MSDLKAKQLGCTFMIHEDYANFMECFEHIDDILRALENELNEQFQDEHMTYDVEWTEKEGDRVIKFDVCNNAQERDILIRFLLKDALDTLANNIAYPDKKLDPWARIKGIMALRLKKEDVQSPLTVEQYEDARKPIEIHNVDGKGYCYCDKERALHLDSIYLAMQREDWTEEEQIKFIEAHAKGVKSNIQLKAEERAAMSEEEKAVLFEKEKKEFENYLTSLDTLTIDPEVRKTLREYTLGLKWFKEGA